MCRLDIILHNLVYSREYDLQNLFFLHEGKSNLTQSVLICAQLFWKMGNNALF